MAVIGPFKVTQGHRFGTYRSPYATSNYVNKSAQSNSGRGPRRRESHRRGGLITTAKVVGGSRRVYYAAPASTDTVGRGFREAV